jgi:hypothetical protein
MSHVNHKYKPIVDMQKMRNKQNMSLQKQKIIKVQRNTTRKKERIYKQNSTGKSLPMNNILNENVLNFPIKRHGRLNGKKE